MAKSTHLDLVPALVEAEKFDSLVESGQTLAATFSPLNDSLAVYLKSTKHEGKHHPRKDEQPIYFAASNASPSMERRLFATDTLMIFSALRNIIKSAEQEDEGWLQSPDALTVIRKLGIDYVNFIKECWVHASQPLVQPEGAPQFTSEHYRILYTTFSLFVVLYLPEPGWEDAPVGDDLLEWLNMHFIEPSTEEGDHLSKLEKPWEDETFWPYLTKSTLRGLTKASVFFLNVLSKHPSPWVQDLTKVLKPLIDNQPRLQNFSSEREFAYSMRRWRDKVKALRIEMDKVPENERTESVGDEVEEDWWDRLSDIVGILEGRVEVIRRVVNDELGGDWKEVVIAWGVFVDGRLRRQDLPDIVARVLDDDMAPDPTNVEDSMHISLLSGELQEALKQAYTLDPWLSAHLADLMVPLQLIENEPDEESSISLRDYYILSYAEYLHSDPALWRVVVDYMYSCDEVGQQRADELLIRVPLRLYDTSVGAEVAKDGGEAEITDDEPARSRSIAEEQNQLLREGAVVGVLKELNETCSEYRREAVRRTICRIASKAFITRKDYGLAVAYSASAEDWTGLGRIVDHVLEEYITSGPQTFIKHASAISGTMHGLQAKGPSHWVFLHRFMFVARYAHFHEKLVVKDYVTAAADLISILSEDLAPKSWWAILLVDTVPMIRFDGQLLFDTSSVLLVLQKLDEINAGVKQGAEDDYLGTFLRALARRRPKAQEQGKEDAKLDAMNRLGTVRLLMAQYFAKCAVSGCVVSR